MNIEEQLNALNTSFRSISLQDPSNMTEGKGRREFALQNIKLITPFDGDAKYLAMFVCSIDEIISGAQSPEDQRFFLNLIFTTLRGPAINIVRREQPNDWTSLRDLLIEEFGEHTPVSTLILDINNIRFKSSIKLLCEEINLQVCRVKDCIKLGSEDKATKLFLNEELNRTSLRTLKKELPIQLTALINANLVSDFKGAMKILKENNVFDNKIDHLENKNTFLPRINKNPIDTIFQPNYLPFAQPFNAMNSTAFHKSNSYKPKYNQNISPQFAFPPNYYYQNMYPNNNYQFPPANYNNFSNPNLNQQLNNHKSSRQNSNIDRIRRFGMPEPMEQDPSNFHLGASEIYPQ